MALGIEPIARIVGSVSESGVLDLRKLSVSVFVSLRKYHL